MNFRGGNDCCVVVKSGTEFHAFADLPNTIHGYYRDVIEQQSELIHYESDCGYKGHNIAYAIWRRFRKSCSLNLPTARIVEGVGQD